MSLREDMISAQHACDDAASTAQRAADKASAAFDEIEDVLRQLSASEEFNAAASFSLPLKAIGETLEDAKGRVVATFSNSEQARCVAAMANAGAE